MFTKLQIGAHTALALAPLSVVPQYQRQGIGTSLILEEHKIAQALGYSYFVVLGSKNYYPRFVICLLRNLAFSLVLSSKQKFYGIQTL